MEDAINYLAEFALEERVSLMREKVADRTRYLTVCLENIYQPQNASAVLRSAEAFGVQDIHIIENIHEYSVNPDIALGTDKWINMPRYTSTAQCIQQLKSNGYRIVATIPEKGATSLENFDMAKGKFALFFGTEQTGLTQYAINHADEFLYVPMCGFVESLNISVSAAITMYTLTTRLRNSNIGWQLSKAEGNEILLDWLKKSVRASDKILKKFYDNKI